MNGKGKILWRWEEFMPWDMASIMWDLREKHIPV